MIAADARSGGETIANCPRDVTVRAEGDGCAVVHVVRYPAICIPSQVAHGIESRTITLDQNFSGGGRRWLSTKCTIAVKPNTAIAQRGRAGECVRPGQSKHVATDDLEIARARNLAAHRPTSGDEHLGRINSKCDGPCCRELVSGLACAVEIPCRTELHRDIAHRTAGGITQATLCYYPVGSMRPVGKLHRRCTIFVDRPAAAGCSREHTRCIRLRSDRDIQSRT